MDSTQQTPAPPDNPASSDPPIEQSPVAPANQKSITGAPGFGEQQPRQPLGNVDTPLASSAPPPQAQAGMPLPEDRAAAAQAREAVALAEALAVQEAAAQAVAEAQAAQQQA